MTRFRREGVTACRVRHPNAVGVLDFGITSRGIAYLVMELLAGHALEDEIGGRPVLPVGRSLRIVAAVCEALAVAHAAGIVHRDIKPGNVFLHQAGGQEVPKVLDFGIAKIAGAAALQQRVTLEGWIVGTPVYMAPERFGSPRRSPARPTSTARASCCTRCSRGGCPSTPKATPWPWP